MAKRAFDFSISAFALLLLWPILLLAMVLIRFDSRGPAIFSQERVGKGFRNFRLLKLRSMTTSEIGTDITYGADQRITALGKFLRKYKIDELPQLWNVLMGDMSIVGPRPEVPRLVFMFPSEFAAVLAVRPGLTSAASIKYRAEADILGQVEDPAAYYVNIVLPDKLRLEAEYVALNSFWRDISLIFATVRTCLLPES
jgi:lipopolysaccharide/colanic/teichoic acid biosynthesis glycosyltransferase